MCNIGDRDSSGRRGLKKGRGEKIMTRRRRIILGVVFVFFMMVCGFVAGTAIGVRFFVPPGSGLAGPAIAIGYGIMGTGLAGIAGIFLAWLLPPRWFLGAALPVTLAGAVFTVIIINIYIQTEAEQKAHLEEAYASLNKFRVTLVHLNDGDAPFRRMEADWGERRYTATTNDAEPTTCTAELSGPEAVALLEALRGVEGVVLRDEFPCAGTLGEVERELGWFIPEAMPPNSGGKHAITAACAAQYPDLDKPFATAAEIFRRVDHAKECS
jgi:hypothetical protein